MCAIPDGLCDDEDPGTTVCIYNATGDGRDAVKCGLDRVGIDIESCVFNCNETGCIPAVSETLLALERPPEIITEFAFWPGSTIPVCVTNPSDSAWAAIRDDIDRTWGRYAGIAFVGWEACNDESTGVKVTLLDPMPRCTGELGHIDRIGYPGSSGSLEITLCRGYVDAYGSGHSSSEALLRVVARHQFGHVLGFDDFHKAYYVWDFMSRGIDSAELDHYAFDLEHFYRLQQAYGRKPAGAFVDTRGNCLTVTGGKLSFATCDGSAFQSFRLENGELRYDDSGDCLSANEITGATSLASCTPPGSSPPPEQAWQPAEVEVRGYGGLCLFKDDTLPDLRLDTCSEPGKAGTRWRVEPVDGGRRIRLRLAGTATCAVVNPAGYLDLLACDVCPETDPECAILDRFELADALHLEHDGLCFATSMEGSPETTRPSPGIVLEPCALQHRMQWNLSGGWEDGTGRVLARWDTAGTPLLVARPMGEGPPEDEIFDFYFREAK